MTDEIKCTFCGAVFNENVEDGDEFFTSDRAMASAFICTSCIIGFYDLLNTDDDELDTVLIQ